MWTIVYALVLVSRVVLAAGPECRALFSQTPKLTAAVAVEIALANDAASSQSAYRNAMSHVLQTKYPSTKAKIDEIRVLFSAVERLFPDWSFAEKTLDSKEHMFVGNVGYALLVTPEGKLFRGMATRLGFDRDDNLIFGPPFKDLVELKP